jgi:hypothetical protein
MDIHNVLPGTSLQAVSELNLKETLWPGNPLKIFSRNPKRIYFISPFDDKRRQEGPNHAEKL